ncbi:MAG: hypothetical protein QM750_19845 [Rubrivivax sp.]
MYTGQVQPPENTVFRCGRYREHRRLSHFEETRATLEAAALQDPAVRNLVENIRAALAEWNLPFQVFDPSADVTFRFTTSGAAKSKAAELGLTRLTHRASDRSFKQVDLLDGRWWVRGGATPPWKNQDPPDAGDVLLAKLQEAIDFEALRAIERRAVLRADITRDIEVEFAHLWAEVDADAFRRIESEDRQLQAALVMAKQSSDFAGYKAGLAKAVAGYVGNARKVFLVAAGSTATGG